MKPNARVFRDGEFNNPVMHIAPVEANLAVYWAKPVSITPQEWKAITSCFQKAGNPIPLKELNGIQFFGEAFGEKLFIDGDGKAWRNRQFGVFDVSRCLLLARQLPIQLLRNELLIEIEVFNHTNHPLTLSDENGFRWGVALPQRRSVLPGWTSYPVLSDPQEGWKIVLRDEGWTKAHGRSVYKFTKRSIRGPKALLSTIKIW